MLNLLLEIVTMLMLLIVISNNNWTNDGIINVHDAGNIFGARDGANMGARSFAYNSRATAGA